MRGEIPNCEANDWLFWKLGKPSHHLHLEHIFCNFQELLVFIGILEYLTELEYKSFKEDSYF